MAEAIAEEKVPYTRKYEQGTALDYNRIYRNYDGSVMEVDQGPSVSELWKMFNNDPQALQLGSALKLPIRGAKWDIIKTDGDTGQQAFIQWMFSASRAQGGMTTPMKSVISKMSNAIMFRFAPFEKVWKIADRGPYVNNVILHKLGYRPPATCEIMTDLNGSFDGFRQRAYKGNKYKEARFIPRNSLVYVHGEDWMPLVGMTPFNPVYKMYLTKLKISFFYYAFLENVAFPRTKAKLQDEDDDEAMDNLLAKTSKLSSMGIIGLFSGEDIEPYESTRSTRDYQTALEYLDWQMSKAVLGQFLDLGTTGERGSFALSKDKSSFFFDSLQAVLSDIEEVINNFLVADLIQFNYGRDASVPRFKFRPLKDDKATDVLEIYKNILIAPTPNITPPFILSLMKKVEEILDLEISPLREYDADELAMIVETIPTAREHLLSKESRAGSGQNPITGEDRNENNKTTVEQPKVGPGGRAVSDAIDIVRQGAPSFPRTPRGTRTRVEDD